MQGNPGPDTDVRLNPSGQLDEDVPCVQCDYNLRGLDAGGKCPECGSTIQRAIWVARINRCDPAWLTRVARGALWLTVGIISLLVLALLSVVATEDVSLMLVASAIAITVVTTIVGIWLATTPDPHQKGLERFIAFRRLARWSICVSLAGCFLVVAAWSILLD